MLKKLWQKVNKQRGSATVEAVVAFTGFILVIFTILSLVNLCRAQMLISNAMDNAAKELSQYAYFYKMSGLQRFRRELGETVSVAKDDVNSVIGSVDQFYNSVVYAVDDSAQAGTNIAEATKEGTLQWKDVESAINGVTANADNINSKIDSMMGQFEAIGDNPMGYMKSLVAIAGSGGMDIATSHLIAAPLAKMFVRQQFGGREADTTLKALGIKDGLEGMNFKMSTMFTENNPEDICLVVFYEVELLQLFNMEVLSAKLSKVSRCRAWLAGDDFQEIVDPTQAAAESGTDAATPEGGTDATTSEGGTDGTTPEGTPDGTDSTDATEPEETTAPTTPPVDTTDSLWHKEDEFYEGSAKDIGFWDIFREEETFMKKNGNFYYGADKDGNPTNVAYTFDHATSADDINFHFILTYQSLATDMKDNNDGKYTETEKPTSGVYVIYVPENISAEEKERIREKAEKEQQKFLDWYNKCYMNSTEENKKYLEEKYAIVGFTIDIREGGGNYDYSSGG